MNRSTFILSLLALCGALTAIYFGFIKPNKKPVRILPYFGEARDNKQHQVRDFTFTNQYKEQVTQNSFAKGIYVCEYFFVTCQSICPIMNKNMKTVFAEFEKDPRVFILSHTVNPENDSAEVLLDYAKKQGVGDQQKWFFVTGSKKELYSIAREGYLLNNEQGDGGPDDFIHTQMFVLVDWNRNLRGFYDGTKSEDIARLKTEMRILLEEYEYLKPGSK
jgi:protein SCO1